MDMDHRMRENELFGEPLPPPPAPPTSCNSSSSSVSTIDTPYLSAGRGQDDLTKLQRMSCYGKGSSEEAELVSQIQHPDTHYNVIPGVVLFCVELLSKYETRLSPAEYLMTQLSKKTRWSDYNRLVTADIFFECIDKDAMLNAIVQRFKISKLNKSCDWDRVELGALKVLTFIVLIESKRIEPRSLAGILHTFGVPLALSFYQFLLNETYENSDVVFGLMEVYTSEFIEKHLYPNLAFCGSILQAVLKECQPPKKPKAKPPKITICVPFKFQSRVPQESVRTKLLKVSFSAQAQVGLLRPKIKNEKEEKAVKLKRASEEIEKRTLKNYNKQ